MRQKAKNYYKTQEKPNFNRGNVDQAFQEADTVLEGIYEHPFQSHAMMEPLAAVAHYQGNKCEMWVGTQTVEMATKELANVTGLPVSACKVNVLPAGGAFGRRWNTDYVVEAGFISKKINAPVKLMWTREDNMKHGAYHPFQHGIYKAAIKDKKLTAWETKPIHVNHWNGAGTWEYDFIYQTPNMRTRDAKMDYIVETGAWRSVGEHLHGFGRECLLDEVAEKLGKNPIDLRLELLDYEIKQGTGQNAKLIHNYAQTIQRRYINTLRKAKQVTNWDKKLPKGKGIGIAVTNFSRTVCAQVAEVTVKNGELKVDKITCITDMGVVVNPHFVTGQMEGGILWALSALKYGGLDIQKGEVVQDNFDTYRVVRKNEVPEIKVHLLESQERPYGAGEPAVPPLAPAVINAIYAATGKRIRKMPVLPKDLA